MRRRRKQDSKLFSMSRQGKQDSQPFSMSGHRMQDSQTLSMSGRRNQDSQAFLMSGLKKQDTHIVGHGNSKTDFYIKLLNSVIKNYISMSSVFYPKSHRQET